MKKLNLILAKLGFFIFFVFNTFVQADELISKNISVIDGDTIILENKKILCSFMGFYIGCMTTDTVLALF